jgi:hypothetical protein
MTQPTISGITAAVVTGDFLVTPATLDPTDVLADLYRMIGCRTVDVVALDDDLDMWLDDEGAYTAAPNAAATAIAQTFGFVWQPYFGTVVITGGADKDGNTLPLTEAGLRLIQTLSAAAAA